VALFEFLKVRMMTRHGGRTELAPREGGCDPAVALPLQISSDFASNSVERPVQKPWSRRSEMATGRYLGTLSLVAALSVGACSPANGNQRVVDTLQVMALSSYSASLGTPIDVYVRNLPKPSAGEVFLHLKGSYTRADGTVERVNLLDSLKRIDGATLRWTKFGPFSNPFTQDAVNPQPGVFQGVLTARVVRNDGSVLDDPQNGLHVTFGVLPSILVDDFEPTTAQCSEPAKRAFGTLSYRVKARAMGFTPQRFTYIMRVPQVIESPDVDPTQPASAAFQIGSDGKPTWTNLQVIHDAAGQQDAVDGAEAFKLPRVPDDPGTYDLTLRIDGLDATNVLRTTQFSMTVGTPLMFDPEVHYALAQLYVPKPMSSCMPGGPQGRQASYTDSHAEARQRMLTYTLSQNWVNSISHNASEGFQNTWSTSDGTTTTRSVTDTSGWSSSESTGASNTQSRSDTTGESVTDGITVNGTATRGNGYNGNNAFAFNLGGGDTAGQGVTIGASDDNSHSNTKMVEIGIKLSITSKDTGTLVAIGGEITNSTDFTLKGSSSDTNTNGHTESQDMSQGESQSSSWGLGDTASLGNNNSQSQTMGGSKSSSVTDTTSTTTASATTVSKVGTDSLNGSTASTEANSGSHTDTMGGADSHSTSEGTTNSEAEGNQKSNVWSVSSTDVLGQGFTGQVVAGTYGIFYRQMARYEITDYLVEYDKCGNGRVAGVETLDDYTWGVDLAQGAACPPFPKTAFPAAQCYLQPCTDDVSDDAAQ
jgi:hypothetical protein